MSRVKEIRLSVDRTRACVGEELVFKALVVLEEGCERDIRYSLDVYVNDDKVSTVYVYFEEGDLKKDTSFKIKFDSTGEYSVYVKGLDNLIEEESRGEVKSNIVKVSIVEKKEEEKEGILKSVKISDLKVYYNMVNEVLVYKIKLAYEYESIGKVPGKVILRLFTLEKDEEYEIIKDLNSYEVELPYDKNEVEVEYSFNVKVHIDRDEKHAMVRVLKDSNVLDYKIVEIEVLESRVKYARISSVKAKYFKEETPPKLVVDVVIDYEYEEFTGIPYTMTVKISTGYLKGDKFVKVRKIGEVYVRLPSDGKRLVKQFVFERFRKRDEETHVIVELVKNDKVISSKYNDIELPSRTALLTVIVLDRVGKPIPNAGVYVDDKLAGYTDSNGSFSTELSTGFEYKIYAVYKGYRSNEVTLILTEDTTVRLVIKEYEYVVVKHPVEYLKEYLPLIATVIGIISGVMGLANLIMGYLRKSS